MVIWLTIASVVTFPHYLTFFNEIAGGPDNGYKILVDSNLDWGQELIGLRKYMTQENIPSVKLSYHGTADPGAYGVVYEPLPSYPYNQWTSDSVPDILLNPPSGVYAISANNLQGLRFKNHDIYATFRQRKPDAIVGHSIFIYRINRTMNSPQPNDLVQSVQNNSLKPTIRNELNVELLESGATTDGSTCSPAHEPVGVHSISNAVLSA